MRNQVQRWRGRVLAVVLGVAALLPASAALARPDFTGMWKIAEISLVVRPGDTDESNLTPKALAARNHFRKYYDPVKDAAIMWCVPHGLPWIMTSPARDYLIDFYQTKDRVTLLFEGLDIHRLIHISDAPVPEQFIPNTFGYSRAHWEGDTLVIVTDHLKAKNPVGTMQRSDKAVVTERWRLLKHPVYGKALEDDITVVDPEVYRKPEKGYNLFVPAVPGSTLNAYGCNDSLWDDHVKEMEAKLPKP